MEKQNAKLDRRINRGTIKSGDVKIHDPRSTGGFYTTVSKGDIVRTRGGRTFEVKGFEATRLHIKLVDEDGRSVACSKCEWAPLPNLRR